MDREAIADRIIQDHVLLAAAGGVIPVPLVDVATVTAIQIDLVRALARVYEVPFDDATGKGIIVSITGASAARVGASIVKAIPGVGTIAGGIAQSSLSGASTYGVGKLFRRHFAGQGSLADLDPEECRAAFEALVERGKGMLESIRPPTSRSVREVTELLERLAKLRDEELISSEEFDQLKGELFAQAG